MPPVCRLCSQPVGQGWDFCTSCHAELTHSEVMMRHACRKCGFPQPRHVMSAGPRASTVFADAISEGNETGSASELIPGCVVCRRLKFEFDGVVPLWVYRERVRDAVVAAKFAHRSPLGDALGRRLGGRVKESLTGDLPQLVTFVPSHLSRQIGRGGIGTQVIAQSVARELGIPCRSLLKATRRIAKQAWLDDRARRENVRGAFTQKKGYALARPPEIANQHILLVDDVLTTGATANEVARVLSDANARGVTLAVVARAIRRD